MRTQRLLPPLAAVMLLFLLAAPSLAYERTLVLPLQPAAGSVYDGLGPALQNVLENVLALHPALEETYLLRHLHRAYADGGQLQSYMMGLKPADSPMAPLAREGAHFIVSGVVMPGGRFAEVKVLDVMTGMDGSKVLPVDTDGGLLAFRKGFMDLFGAVTGLPYPAGQARKALTQDPIGHEALALLGLSYGGYMLDSFVRGDKRLGLPLARKAFNAAPKSYLAVNMLAWQLYASGNRRMAATLFREALARDPDGVDALDGMIQSSQRAGGMEAALPWALRKARTRGGDTGPALSQMYVHAGTEAMEDKNISLASRRYATATALDPESTDASWDLAIVLSRRNRIREAFQALDKRLTIPSLPAIRAQVLNHKADLAGWIAMADKKAGHLDEAKKGLDVAMSFLKQNPMPDMHTYSQLLRELASVSLAKGDAEGAVKFLELVQPEPGTDPLLVDALLVQARAAANRIHEASEDARVCLSIVAERQRTREPVPSQVYSALIDALAKLGETQLAQSLARESESRRMPTDGKARNRVEQPLEQKPEGADARKTG